MLDYQNVLPFLSKETIAEFREPSSAALAALLGKTGLGSEFTGWVDYHLAVNNELAALNAAAKAIRDSASVLLVIGIGGSYLGAKSALMLLSDYFSRDGLEIIFAGQTLSAEYTAALCEYLRTKEFAINVISKSGTTMEPAIAFRVFQKLAEEKYGDDARKRIYCTTSIGRGALYDLAKAKGYQVFPIPEDIGGRYSVLTAVGLLPLASAGYDIGKIIAGARDAYDDYTARLFWENDCLLYAAIRNALYRQGKLIEVLAAYEPKFADFGEWYKQLYGESEGKDHQGIFPVSVLYSTDLHSLGQYLQDGRRHLFETIITVGEPKNDIRLQKQTDDGDGLNYLAGKTLDEVNKQAFKGTLAAHVAGGVPNLVLTIPRIDEYQYGRLAYFFMLSCGVSGYLLGVNPFVQDGVEAYKKNMLALLGKAGY